MKGLPRIGPFLVLLTLGWAVCMAPSVCRAQGGSWLNNPFGGIFSGTSSPGQAVEREMPGLLNPLLPMLFPPTFGAEARTRAEFVSLNGTLENTNTGKTFDLNSDLGFVDSAELVEVMVRLQLSRFSGRLHKDMYLRTFEGNRTRFDWPEWRLGLDIDAIDTALIRFGINFDFYPERPDFVVNNAKIDALPDTPFKIEGPRPFTGGLHLTLNPVSFASLGVSLEGRARKSLRTGSELDEFTLAGGFNAPVTVLGTVAFRAGYRYSSIEWGTSPYMVRTQWSGVFGEIAYRY